MPDEPVGVVADEGVPSDDPAPGPEGLSLLMISVHRLAAHPGNVRQDLALSAEFAASVAQFGVRIPLLVTTDGDGGLRVIEGHRRLAAAVKAGLAEVPCIVDPGRSGDEAGQYLDMLVANGGGYRQNFSAVEEAAALFSAAEAGATRTRLRKATGRKAQEVKAALAVGGMSAQTREAAGELAAQLDLDQLALLAEFDGDEDAVEKLLTALRRGMAVDYVAERIRQDRADAAEHDRLVAELEAARTPVTADMPAGAVALSVLTQDEEDLTPESHATCPGRGVYFPAWNRLTPIHYCAQPSQYGHAVRGMPRTAGALGAAPGAESGAGAQEEMPGALPDLPDDGPPDPSRRLVIEGNQAWKAAAQVRKRWLATVLFARRAAPRQTAVFVARTLLAMAEPVRSSLADTPGMVLFSEVTGSSAEKWLEACDTAAGARLPLLMLAPIVTAFEYAMTGVTGTYTWRTDRSGFCPRREAGRYLSFLASAGYQLSVIEQALADDVPYTGDTADPSLLDQPAEAHTGSDTTGNDPAPADGDIDGGGETAPTEAIDPAEGGGPVQGDDAAENDSPAGESSPEAA